MSNGELIRGSWEPAQPVERSNSIVSDYTPPAIPKADIPEINTDLDIKKVEVQPVQPSGKPETSASTPKASAGNTPTADVPKPSSGGGQSSSQSTPSGSAENSGSSSKPSAPAVTPGDNGQSSASAPKQSGGSSSSAGAGKSSGGNTPSSGASSNVSDSTTVYVSDKSNTIHSKSNCSGMKYYREMSRSEADANNYKYCSKWW